MTNINRRIIGVIPARYSSTRFLGKPLALINGIPMIEHVYLRAKESKILSDVIVATDDERIYDCVLGFNGKAVMTDTNINTGTDRIYYAIKKLGIKADIVINIQGDEPLIKFEVIDKVALALCGEYETAVCSTAIKRADESDLDNHNVVKTVIDKNGYALYFSRSKIPYMRNIIEGFSYYSHIGIYGYDFKFLEKFVSLEQTILEKIESLEQLRILENGEKIKTVLVDYSPIGVDTKEDLIRVEKIMKEN